MKKILGSPIGLGEVNLTVDNRVRRNIKEYFGDVVEPVNDELVVSDEFFKDVLFDTTYKRARSSNVTPKDDEEYLRILLVAEEQFLNKIFMITDPDGNDLPDKSEFFIPFKKGFRGMLESKPLLMKKSLLNKIWVDGKNGKAKLPTTDEEKEAVVVWLEEQDAKEQAELAAAGKALEDDAGKDAAKETDKTSKPECEAQYCKKYIKDGLDGYCVSDYKDEQKNEKGELITGCVESDPSGCCISKSCREKKGIWQTNDKKYWFLGLSIFCGVLSILMFIIVICRYYYYKKTGKGNHESITTTYPYSDYLKKSFVLGGLCCLLLIPWAFFEAKIVSISVSCPEDKDDDSCPEGLEERSLAYRGAGCPKCGPKCSTDERYCKKKCSCVPKCKVGETFCKKKCSCITAGMPCTSY